MSQRNALGKGLAALLNDEEDAPVLTENVKTNSLAWIPIEQIVANPFQPRTKFEEEALEELTESIKVHGVIQPITVRKIGTEEFEIISGERRTRASIMAGLKKVPAYVRLANDQEMLEMALIENIQREELNPIEISLTYKRLIEECQLKQEELGERVGKKRTTVNNYLRLLRLPEVVQQGIIQGLISMGHAKPLVSLESKNDQLNIFKRTVEEKLSVRKVEQLVKMIQEISKGVKKGASSDQTSMYEPFNVQREKLIHVLASNVQIKGNKKGKGAIQIQFDNMHHLKDILRKLDELKLDN
jgi:ParB family chromosome partitioning protein